MKLHYFHSPHGNFGDDLNGWLWPKLLPGLWDEGEDDITARRVAGGFDRLPEPDMAPTPSPEPAPPVPSEPVIEFPLAASASTPASQRPVPRAPARRSSALWTNARPFAVDTRPPRPANEDRPRHINE